VLAGIDLVVGPGVTVVAGANGSGKSTLLRVLAGLHRIRRGRVRVAGAELTARPGRRAARGTVGYLAQDADFPGTFTVAEAVAYGAWLQRIHAGSPRVARSIDRVGLAALADRPLGRLSGGEHRRALLAQAMVHEPPVLLLDEPTVGLDATHRLELHAVLRRHVGEGGPAGARRCVVVVTHHGDDVVRLADRVVVLARGRVAFDGSVDGLASVVDGGPDAGSVDRALGAIEGGTVPTADLATTCGEAP
jgi:ABC-2 type transport system ATP-binding protein